MAATFGAVSPTSPTYYQDLQKMQQLTGSLYSSSNSAYNMSNNIPSIGRMYDMANIGSTPVAQNTPNISNTVVSDNTLNTSGIPTGMTQQQYDKWLNNKSYNDTFSNWLGAGQLALSAFSGIGSYINGKNYLKLAKDQLAQQQNQFNETYNNQLKEYNTALADRLRARAAFETGDSTAYNDEITANSMQRGQTGNSSSDYLNYKRSSNADNPYNKDTKKETD